MGNEKVALSAINLRVWYVEGGVHPTRPPEFLALGKISTDPTKALGEDTRITAPDPTDFNRDITVGTVKGSTERATLSVGSRYTAQKSIIMGWKNKGCRVDIYALAGKCGNPQDFSDGSEKWVYFPDGQISNHGFENFGAYGADQNKPTNEMVDMSSEALVADLCLDTSRTNIHQLLSLLKERVLLKPAHEMSLLIQSFGFKNGAPSDSDFVFDLRCLPNPHWDPTLREFTGQDPAVRNFLESRHEVMDMLNQLYQFLETWIPQFNAQNRYYLTISLGCTGGQHRSVYMAEKLCTALRNKYPHVSLRHRELE